MSDFQDSRNLVLSEAQLAQIADRVAAAIVARMTAVMPSDADVIECGELRIDLRAHEVFVAGEPVDLKPREFAVLVALARNVGRVFAREQIVALAWPEPEAVEDVRVVDVAICRVRRKLGAATVRVESIAGIGYKLTRTPVRPRA